jgi:hypothetical protein
VPLAVLFRDPALVVVDKPAGLAVDEDIVSLASRELGRRAAGRGLESCTGSTGEPAAVSPLR